MACSFAQSKSAVRPVGACCFLSLVLSFTAIFPTAVQSQTESFVGRWVRTLSGPQVYPSGTWFVSQVDPLGNFDIVVHDGDGGLFLKQYDGAGNLQWTSSPFVGTGTLTVKGMDCNAAGDIFLIGSFTGTAVIGSDSLVSAGDTDIFLSSFASNGAYRLSRRYGSTESDEGQAVAVTSSGDVLIGGTAWGTIDMGGGPLPFDVLDVVLASFDSTLTHRWSLRYVPNPNADWASATNMVVDDSDNLYVGGSYVFDLGFEGGIRSNGYLAKFGTDGGFQWMAPMELDTWTTTLAIDPLGNVDVLVSGQQDEAVNFALAKQYRGDGQVNWSSPWLTPQPGAMCVDAAGNLYLTGLTKMLKLGSDGTEEWERSLVTGGAAFGTHLATDPAGDLFVAGMFRDAITLSDSSYVSTSQSDVFIIKGPLPVVYEIGSIADVPGDQGGFVTVPFGRANHDVAGANHAVTQYQILMRNDPVPAASSRKSGAAPTAVTWKLAGSIPADGSDQYELVVATDADSTRTHGMHNSVFKVRAVTGQSGVFYETPPDSGYSVDNVAPPAVAGLAYAAGVLSWDASSAPDVDHYTVRGSLLVNGPMTTIGDVTQPAMDVSLSPFRYYFVTATDRAGNVGAVSTVAGESDFVPPPTDLSYDLGVLNWTAPADFPIASYHVYGSMLSTLSPAAVLVGQTAAYSFDVASQSYPWYFVRAVDVASHESIPARTKDNLKPQAPGGLVYHGLVAGGQYSESLTWDASPDPGFDQYVVYGSPSTAFNSDTVRIWVTVAPGLIGHMGGYKYYLVTVIDHAGNESTPAVTMDNVVPIAPAHLEVRSAVLSWARVADASALTYKVYGSSNAIFETGDELIQTTDHTSLDVRSSQHPYYVVTAVDRAGNVSAPAILKVDPRQAYPLLLTAYPNPFNPAATIRFDIPSQGHVVVTIFDARGELVATVADEQRGPGSYAVKWDGTSAGGNRAGSGIYFAKLQHATGTKTLKLVLVR